MTAHTIKFDEIDHLFDIIKQEHPHGLCVHKWCEDDEDGNLINFVNKKNCLLAQYFRNENHVIFYDANEEAIEDYDSDYVEDEEDDDSDYMDEEESDSDSEEEETCEVCHQSAHLGSICPNGQINIFEDIRPEEILDQMQYDLDEIKELLDESSFVRIQEGMGCHTIVRLADDSASLEGLFVHADDYYNPQKMMLVNQFVQGYNEVYSEEPMYHEWNPDF